MYLPQDVLLQSENEYQIEGFKTVLPIKSDMGEKTRIICLIKNEWMSKCTIIYAEINDN